MSAITYPTSIYTEPNGWGRIHRGHDLAWDRMLADLRDYTGDQLSEDDVEVEEVHLSYQPRVKWCSNHGDPCDMEGEWHGHWHGLKPSDNESGKFTVITPKPMRHRRGDAA